jgi:hypothetical protein
MSILRPTKADRAGSRTLATAAFVVTLALHGALVGGLWYGHARADKLAVHEPIGQFVEVQAVRFGKPRDLSFLPHKEAPPVRRAKELRLSSGEHSAPKKEEEKEKEKEQDLLARTHTRMFEMQNDSHDEDATGSAATEGDPHGQVGGSATVGKGPIYYQHLQAAVQNLWVVPTTIPDRELAGLRAVACIRIDESGKIVHKEMRTPSGNARFDATLLDALNQLDKFEPPTPDVKDDVTGEGICMSFAKTR